MRAQEWMLWLGFADATVTNVGADGGVDVVSSRGIAQVKYRESAASRPQLQALHGEAARRNTAGLFFSVQGYTAEATAWANVVHMPIFILEPGNGSLVPCNDSAHELRNAARGSGSLRITTAPLTSLRERSVARKIAGLETSVARLDSEHLRFMARRPSARNGNQIETICGKQREVGRQLRREQARLQAIRDLAARKRSEASP